MAEKYYLDPSIWRDYYENRSDRFRQLGEWALKLIKDIVENKELVIYSDIVIDELKIKYDNAGISDIFEIVKKQNLLVKASISELQIKEAAKLCKERKVAFGDALHAVLARDNNAVMITRDKHFLELADVAVIRKPEELI